MHEVSRGGTKGILQQNEGGTVFIDEAADLSEHMQTFLLQVLDRQSISKTTGTGEQIILNVRLIFATNADLERLVEEGRFRPDLYRRIQSRTIRIPSLADRAEDIPLFVRHWRGDCRVEPGFLLALLRYHWPGNVGELADVVNKALAKARSRESPLCASMLDLPTVGDIANMDTSTVEGEVYGLLTQSLQGQGYDKGKGLHRRMAEILGCSPATISKMAKN